MIEGLPALPGYELLHELGRGGMGVVWLARQVSLDRLVAVKVLVQTGELDLKRFRREGRLVQRLAHPGVVRLIDYSVDGEVPHLVFEHVNGARTLGRVLTLETVGRARALQIALEVADALAHVHAAGIVHRDIKPGNVLIGADERARLIDLGLAKNLNADATSPITQSGEMMGTLAYMAPEQLAGTSPTPRADVYAFGLVLYELLCARIVFAGEGPGVIKPGSRLALEIPPPSTRGADVPPEIEAVLMRCLARDTQARFADGGEVAAALERAIERKPGPPPAPAPPRARARRRPSLVRKLAPPLVLAMAVMFAAASATLVRPPRLSSRQVDPASPPLTSPPGPDRVELARRLQRRLQAVRSRMDERWLAGFAAAHRGVLRPKAGGLPVTAAERAQVSGAMREHLEQLAVQPALDEFLAQAHAYFADGRVPEPERWAMRSDLCDVELLEHFCREHGLPWPAARSVAGIAGEWDRPVEPERVPHARARNWVVRESWYESAFSGPARTLTFHVQSLPARHALLWFSTTAWRSGYLVEVLVNRRLRRLIARPPGRPEPPRLTLAAVEYRDVGGTTRNADVELLSGESWIGARGYMGTWLPPGVLALDTDVRYRVIELPLASAAITDAALRERVLTVFSGTETSP